MIKITDVNYIDLENKMIEVKEVHIPSNINKEIDGRNKYILPGLVDMHTHITPNNAKHYLYSGVTSVRNTGGNYELIEHIDSISPRVYATYRFIDGEPGLWGPSSYGNISTNDIKTATAGVEELYKQDARFVKVYGNIQEDVLKAVIEKSNEFGLEVAADLLHTKSIDAVKAANYGVKWLEHASSIVHSLYPNYNTQISEKEFNEIEEQEVGQEQLTEVLNYLKEKEVKILPTLTLYRHLSEGRKFKPSQLNNSKQMKLYDGDEIFTINEQFNAIESHITDEFRRRQKWEYEQVKNITKEYIELGGEVYIGTDAPAGVWVYPGISLIEELNEFKELNLDAYEILKKATLEAKSIIGEDHGYLLLNSNPIESFENILNLEMVILDGVIYEHQSIENHIVDVEKLKNVFEEVEKKYQDK